MKFSNMTVTLNNRNLYTTPGESDALIRSGLPACTADMFYDRKLNLFVVQNEVLRNIKSVFDLNHDMIPCWSAGRLLHIYETCTGDKFVRTKLKDGTFVDLIPDLVLAIEYAITPETTQNFDISKLEE